MSSPRRRSHAASSLVLDATRIEQLESSLRAIELKLTPEEIAALDSPYTPKRVQF